MIRLTRLVMFFIILIYPLFSFGAAIAKPWKFEIAPYLWAIDLHGRVSIGPITSNVDQSFTDVIKYLDFAGMLYASAHKDQLGFYVNGLYAALSDNGQFHNINISGKNEYGIFSGGISYIIFERDFTNDRKVSLEPYAGLRYTINNTRLTINRFTLTKDVDWTDPVVGVRFDYSFNKKWSSFLMGDIGGTDTTTHYSYSAGAFLGYQPTSWQYAKAYLGYRILGQHYQTGTGRNFYDWDMKSFGPVLAFGFSF